MPSVLSLDVMPELSNVETQRPERDYYDYAFARGIYGRLIESWTLITNETNRQRALRYVKGADSQDLRNAGILKEDELYCPVRLIDANIRAEQPALIQYITQSRRSIIFASKDAAPVDGLEKLEADFTTKARYLGWEIPFIRNTDGAQAHGWDSVEIKFDPEYPGNFCIEHIGHDRLIFSVDSEEIEAQEVIAIKMMLTSNQLRAMAKDGGFNGDQVEKLVGANPKSTQVTDASNECFKVFFKQDGIVNTCWYARVCDGYLKNPEPLFLGMRDFSGGIPEPEVDPFSGWPIEGSLEPLDYPPIFETEFPIVALPYIESNDPRIIELVGRVKLDESSQEAASALQSGMVNGTMRASNIFASPMQTDINNPNAAPVLTNVVVGNGRILSQPTNFYHIPYPDTAVLQFLQGVVTQNKQEQSQVNFSVLNRKDSGKTATEVQAASAKSAELGSVQVILMSIFIRRVYAKCWRIYQNRVLQGKIIVKDLTLLNLFGEDIGIDPNTGAVVQCSEATEYIIKSSGDIDVVQRQEKLQRLIQGWEVFGKTPLASEYLKDIIRYSFPEDASRYVQILDGAQMQAENQLKMLLQKCGQVIQALAVDPSTGEPKAEVRGQEAGLMQLAQQIQMALTAPGTQGQMAPQQ